MKKILLTITLFAVGTIFFSVEALAAPLRIATPAAGNVREMIAKISGPISAIGTSSLTVNGATVNITSTTTLLRRFGAKAALSEFSMGDQVQVMGKWTDNTKTAINAKVVRNLSIQKRHGTFVGTISTTNSTGFTLATISRGTQTVTASATTKSVDRQGKALTLSAILAGHKVMVRGLWDNKLNLVTEVTFVRDYSLPATPSASAR